MNIKSVIIIICIFLSYYINETRADDIIVNGADVVLDASLMVPSVDIVSPPDAIEVRYADVVLDASLMVPSVDIVSPPDAIEVRYADVVLDASLMVPSVDIVSPPDAIEVRYADVVLDASLMVPSVDIVSPPDAIEVRYADVMLDVSNSHLIIQSDTNPPQSTFMSAPSGIIDYNDVFFEWSGTDDITPDSMLLYSYKLEGWTNEWSSWTYLTNKTYTNLPDKEYTFLVRAQDLMGNIESSPAVSSFTVNLIQTYNLVTNINPSGGGSISLNPSGGTYNEGTIVTVTVSPASGYQFDHWSGDASGTSASIDITMDSNNSVTAHFAEVVQIYTLSTSVDPAGAGSVSLNPASGTYDEGTTITATAHPVSGYEFDHWSGDASGTSASIDITMDSNKSITAYFTSSTMPPEENQPPTVTLITPATDSILSGIIIVEGTANDTDGSVQSVEINIDGGPWLMTNGTYAWTYRWDTTKVSNGSHTIYARSYDGESYSDTCSVVVVVDNVLSNQPPTCSLSAHPISGIAPLTTTFTLDANDTDGSITSWTLDVDNDGNAEFFGAGRPSATKKHTYNSAGVYTAKLTVTDNKGGVGYVTSTVSVNQNNTDKDGGYHFGSDALILLLIVITAIGVVTIISLAIFKRR